MPTTKKAATRRKAGKAAKGATGRLPTATVNLNIQGVGLGRDDETPKKLPKAKVTTELQKLIISLQKGKPGLLGDQRRRLVSSMGCVSNVGGPGC